MACRSWIFFHSSLPVSSSVRSTRWGWWWTLTGTTEVTPSSPSTPNRRPKQPWSSSTTMRSGQGFPDNTTTATTHSRLEPTVICIFIINSSTAGRVLRSFRNPSSWYQNDRSFNQLLSSLLESVQRNANELLQVLSPEQSRTSKQPPRNSPPIIQQHITAAQPAKINQPPRTSRPHSSLATDLIKHSQRNTSEPEITKEQLATHLETPYQPSQPPRDQVLLIEAFDWIILWNQNNLESFIQSYEVHF